MKSPLNIIFTIDANFLQHFTVTIVSLLENNKDPEINFYLIHDIDDQTLLNEVVLFIKETYHTTLNLIKVDNSIFDGYRITGHYSKAVYFRLLMAEILPDTIDKVLYLDTDIVVAGSIKELALFELKDDQHVVAVDDMAVDNIPRLNRIGFPTTRYFNSGVMLINVKAWREQKPSVEFVKLANQHMEHLVWWDQDILNMFFYKDWVGMDPEFNGLLLGKKLPETPVIVHYNGTSKPWLYVHDHPYKSLYWDYLKLTPFKDFKYPDYNLKELVRKYYIKLQNLLNLRTRPLFKD